MNGGYRYFVVDEWVLEAAAGNNHGDPEGAVEVLDGIVKTYGIVVDNAFEVWRKYYEKAEGNVLIYEWVRALQYNTKRLYLAEKKLPTEIFDDLSSFHFHDDDIIWVELAYNLVEGERRIITEDSDFTESHRNFLRQRISIIVYELGRFIEEFVSSK